MKWFVWLGALAAAGCGSQPARQVVVYAAVDQVHAEPVLKEYERRSGVRVRALYDVEASKTTGLAQRLVAEWIDHHIIRQDTGPTDGCDCP